MGPLPPSPKHLLRPGPLLLPATSPRGSRGGGQSAEGQFLNSSAARSPRTSAGILLRPRGAAGPSRRGRPLPRAPRLRFPTRGPGPGASRTLTGSAAPQQSGAGKAALQGRERAGASARGAGSCRPESRASGLLAGPRAGCALRDLGAAPGWVPSAGGRAVAGGSPPPLTLLSARLHLFVQHPFLILLLSLFPLPPLLSAVSSLVFHWSVEKGGGGKKSRLLNLSDTLEIISSWNLEMT